MPYFIKDVKLGLFPIILDFESDFLKSKRSNEQNEIKFILEVI